MTDDEKEDVHKNWLYLNDEFDIDVPPALTSFTKYRASLAHKVRLNLITLNILSTSCIQYFTVKSCF